MKRVIVACAMKRELGGLFEDCEALVVETGIGKINATMFLTATLELVKMEMKEKWKDVIVVNFGTAASKLFPQGVIVSCTEFVQHDMNAVRLGVEKGKTPFGFGDMTAKRFDGLKQAMCSTGDEFVGPDFPLLKTGLVDMEAYALARVCQWFEVPFYCIKAVSDGGDVSDWKKNIDTQAPPFRAIYEKLRNM